MIQFLKRAFSFRKRKSARIEASGDRHIQLNILGAKFSVADYSNSGISLKNEKALSLGINNTYLADLSVHGKLKCSLRIKVVRITPTVTGCKVLNGEEMKELLHYLDSKVF